MNTPTLESQASSMGRVVVPIRVQNLKDLWSVQSQLMEASKARSIDIAGALVDTGCIGLALPTRMIVELGLQPVRTRNLQTTNGVRETKVYEPVHLTVQERTCAVEVYEVPDSCPALVGQIPLEILDFVVDPRNQKLIGNPDHGGEWMNDFY